jgi:hypothetical protein
MPRAEPHLHLDVADAHRVAAGEPAIGRERLDRREAEHAALHRQLVDPEPVLDVRALDRQPEPPPELRRAAAVVQMSVREQDFLQRHALLGDLREQCFDVAAGIDERRLAARRADRERAVLLERCHRDDDHAQTHGGAGKAAQIGARFSHGRRACRGRAAVLVFCDILHARLSAEG